MGLFDFLKKSEKPKEDKPGGVLLAMVMFNNGETFELEKVIGYLKSHWSIEVTKVSGSNETVNFAVQGEVVALLSMQFQIPWADVQKTAQYAYNWTTAAEDLKHHNAHVIVTVMSNTKSQIERYGIWTKVISSILATSNGLGVYQGSQSLLISKEQYLDSAEVLKSGLIPVDLWVYIGLRKGDIGNNAYTYGLTAFGKLEMEFINANLELGDMYSFLINICAYVIKSNVNFKSGETLGFTMEQKIKITKSPGLFVEGQSLKLEL